MIFGIIKAGALPEHVQRKGSTVGKNSHANEERSAGALIGEIVGSIRTVASFNAEQLFVQR